VNEECAIPPPDRRGWTRRKGKPHAVVTGSTILSENVKRGHSNVGHVVDEVEIAEAYLNYWKRLDEGAANGRNHRILTVRGEHDGIC